MSAREPSAAFTLEYGVTVCVVCRERDAELVVDPGERFARPLCFDCVEDELEREEAQALSPAFGEVLDRARKDVRYRPLPRPIVREYESLDHSKLNALAKSWSAYRQTISDLARCWAILPGGGRCARAAVSEGVCLTHAHGCRLPGLGWRGDQPQGRIVVRRGRSAA